MTIEAGIQLHLPTYRDHSLSELTRIARAADSSGFQQIWVTDNLESRSNFVVLAAFAPIVGTKLGTAIMAQYFRNPLEAAASLIPLSELLEGRELTVGLGTGNVYTSQFIEMPRPIRFMRETAEALRRLIAGEKIKFKEYPLLRDYFHFVSDTPLEIAMKAPGPIPLYGGGSGPLGLKAAGEVMDGMISGWTSLPNATLGRLGKNLEIANTAAERRGNLANFGRVVEVKISIARDHNQARNYVREHSAALRTLSMRKRGYSDDELRKLGIDPSIVDEIAKAHNSGVPFSKLTGLVTDPMIDFGFIAGNPEDCRERMKDVVAMVHKYGFKQVIFSELGPDQVEAIELIANELLPALQ